MILGATRTSGFQRPAGANPNFQPRIPNVGFYSGNFFPFSNVMERMSADMLYRPPLPGPLGPQVLPNVPPPAAPAAVPDASPVGPVVPKPGGTAGFAGAFGSTGGTGGGHMHVDPYMVMRNGVIPGVSPSGSNLRAGVRNAGSRVHRSMPFQTAPLAPLPPPVSPTPSAPAIPAAPAAKSGGVQGLMGALFGYPMAKPHRWSFPPIFVRGRRRPTVAQESCEKVGPRLDGSYVTICNGRVTQVSDANGNTLPNPWA